MQDARKTKRYPLRTPVYLTWRDGEKLLELSGVTRDVSMKGIFFLASAALHVGTHLKVDVVLPTLGGQRRAMKLHGEGTVLRVEPQGRVEQGIAAKVAFEGETEETFLAYGLVQ